MIQSIPHLGDCAFRAGLPCAICAAIRKNPKTYSKLLVPSRAMPKRPKQRGRRPEEESHGPGTELIKLIKPLGFPTCGACSALAAKMDAGGPPWCAEHEAEIVEQIFQRGKQAGVMKDVDRLGGTEDDVRQFILNLVHEAVKLSKTRTKRIIQRNNGLGDALLGLCAVLGLQAEMPDCKITYGSKMHTMAFTALFEHDLSLTRNIRSEKWDGRLDGFYDYTCRSDPQWRRLAKYCEAIGVKHPVMPMLKDRDTVRAIAADMEGVIVLAPCVASDGSKDREWPRRLWVDLYDALEAAGHRVVVVDDNSHRMVPFGNRRIWLAKPARHVASLMINAACVVGNDSGMTHLSGILGAPTVVLCGSFDGRKIHDFYHRCSFLYGNLECSGCFRQQPFKKATCGRVECASLATIGVDRVVAAVNDAVRVRGGAVRLVSWNSPQYQALSDVTWPTKAAYAARHGFEAYNRLCHHGMTCWQQVEWWIEQLALMRPGQWLWSLGSDAAVTGDQEPPISDAHDVVLALDGFGINSDSLLLRNAPATVDLLRKVLSLQGACRNEQEALACALSGEPNYREVKRRLAMPLHADGRPASDELYRRSGGLFSRFRVRLVPQRAMNAYATSAYGWSCHDEQAWHPGDLVLHVPGKPLQQRLVILNGALS